MEKLKIKLLKLLLNSTFKYNKKDCREKWLETTIDDLTYLLRNIYHPLLFPSISPYSHYYYIYIYYLIIILII